MTVQLDEFKARQRAMWGSGDYASLSDRIAEVGELVVARAEIEAGMRVLDVACGAGNAALPAARAGGRVTGLDLSPTLLERGRAKAEAAGLEIEWVEGDAEQLPFEDGSFDRVLSTFGHMFAPRHRQAADELIRVCRGGGAVVTATWAADGVFGAMSAAGAPFAPPPSDDASPPTLWGDEAYLREIFGGAAASVGVERHVNWIEDDSLESFADLFMERFPPMVAARAALGDRFHEMRDAIVDVWRRYDQGGDDGFRLPQEYLLTVVRLPGDGS
jgi:SAM-dependent methyltransferase